jgi:ABC-type transport system involved in multi-copper enzyme maturation permease subunit
MFGFMTKDGAGFNFDVMSLSMQTQTVAGLFIVLSFIWLAGVPIALLAAFTCANFISKEEADGTLLLLVSKPVRRYEIILGKFLAFLVNMALLELTILLFVSLLLFNLMGIDPFVLDYLLGIVPFIFLYSMFIAFIFGAISTTLSVLSRSSVKIVIALVALVMLIYFGFPFLIRVPAVSSGIYDKYMLYYFDVNYHLGNSYILFLSNYKISPDFQAAIGQFAGVYETGGPGRIYYDPDLAAMPPSLELKTYSHPFLSMVVWLVLSILIFIGGLFRFERKEIY